MLSDSIFFTMTHTPQTVASFNLILALFSWSLPPRHPTCLCSLFSLSLATLLSPQLFSFLEAKALTNGQRSVTISRAQTVERSNEEGGARTSEMAPGERTMKKEMTVRWRSEEAERVIDELEQENAQLKQELEAKVTDGGTEGETRSSGGKRKRATDPVDELQRASLHLASGIDRAQRLQIAIWSYEDTLAEELEAETKNTLAELEAETEKAVDACTDAIRVANASVNNTISKGLTPLINGLHDDQVQSYQAPMGRLGPEALKVATAGGDWARLDRFQNFRPIPVLDQSHGAGEDPIHIQYKQPFQSLTENQEGCIDQAHVHAQVEEVAAKKSPASPVVVDLTSTLQDPVFGHLPSENERIKELEQEIAQLKKEEISNRRCLEEARQVINDLIERQKGINRMVNSGRATQGAEAVQQ